MVSKIVFATNYSTVTSTTCYNAAGQPLSTVQKQLISQLSSTLESKSVFVSERGLTSTQWTEYSENTKRIQYSAVPTSDITAETVMVDGFVLSQKDTAGVVTTATRSYTASGMLLRRQMAAALFIIQQNYAQKINNCHVDGL